MTEPAIDAFETERLHLRLATDADAAALVALDGDPAVMRFINGGRPSSAAEVEDGLRASAGQRWVATDADGHFVGWFSIRTTGPTERELGYRLRRERWGLGYATEGALAVLAIAFDDLGCSRVWAQTMTVNARSRAVLERCGMRYVRTFHLAWDEPIDGAAAGDVEYELLRDDWRRRRAGP